MRHLWDSRYVVYLQSTVAGVMAFTQLTTPAFHVAYPAVVNQTLANLITVYERVYRRQYVSTTAAQHHHYQVPALTGR